MPTPPEWLRRLRTSPLRTRRLVIRPLKRGDDHAIYPAVRESIEELAPWLPWASEGYDPAACRGFVRAAMRDFAAGRDYALVMFTRDGHFVGGTGFHVRGGDSARYYEIGYWCRTPLTGHGYVTEAVKALLRLAFRAPEVHRVEIRCDPRNRASERVIRKAGLKKEGHLLKVARDAEGHLVAREEFTDTRFY
jgi:RimJ/RimL family protein N-acetyltransferase